MSKDTKIEWADATWNPLTGCDRVSAGCANCYAEAFTNRFKGTPGHYFEGGFKVTLRPEKLEEPLHWRKPKRIFVCSMADLFHPDVPFEYIDKVFAVMALAKHHTFMVLTKRPERALKYFSGKSRRGIGPTIRSDIAWQMSMLGFEFGLDRGPGRNAWYAEMAGQVDVGNIWPLPNIQMGVSAENQPAADLRIPQLLRIPAAVRFLSCEPLLGPVDLNRLHSEFTHEGGAEEHRWDSCLSGKMFHIWADGDVPAPKVDWVIAGGESGKGARPMHPDWVRQMRDDCVAAGVPFFFKQWGEWSPGEPNRTGSALRGTLRVAKGGYLDSTGTWRKTYELNDFRLPPDWVQMRKPGKNAAGRTLDGRTWDELPAGPA